MWKILICDDDEVFVHILKKDIISIAGNKIKQIEIFNEKDALEFYVADHPNESNIVILDIKLGDDNGIRAAEKVLQYQPNSQIIFISGYDGYFLDVYDVDHVYLLRKPVDKMHLEKALNRAGKKLHDLKVSTLSVSNKQGTHNIPFNEIIFFENERRRVHVHTIESKITFYGRFDDLTDRLDSRFIRCHNSYIVNMARVREMRNKKFIFDGDMVVPISKTYYAQVREDFMSYVGSEMLFVDSGIKSGDIED